MDMDGKTFHVSIVIPVKNEGEHIRNTLESIYAVKSRVPFEVIVVDDSSTDGCCEFLKEEHTYDALQLIETNGVGAARARNIGAAAAQGSHYIFCDAHLFFEDNWIETLLKPVLTGQADAISPGIAPTTEPNVVGYGQTLTDRFEIAWNGWAESPFPTAILPGGCLCITTKEAFHNIGGFDAGSMTWGYEDVELSIRLWLFGYSCFVNPAVKVLHYFREAHPYEVQIEHVYYNLLRTAFRHLSDERVEKCKQLITYGDPDVIVRELSQNGIMEERYMFFEHRRYADDWFFEQFQIPF